MITDGRVTGLPLVDYASTKAAIEALTLTAADAGARAYATDVDEIGAYDGAAWAWLAMADLAKYSIYTGLLSGGAISINADPTKLDVASGTAVYSDISDVDNPVIEIISWDATTIDSGLAGIRSKWVGIQRTGAGVGGIITSGAFTPLQKRTIALLGRYWGTGTATITGIGQYTTTAFNLEQTVNDLTYALGSMNIGGNVFSPNGANLYLDKSAGQSFRYAALYESVPTAPNIITDGALSAITPYQYHLQGATSTTAETDIEPDYYDNAGVKTALSPNKWTVQRVYYFPVSQTVHITYGQVVYDKYDDAAIGVNTESPVLNSEILDGAILRAYLVLKNGATDLSDTDEAVIVTVHKIGGGGSTPGVTYHASLLGRDVADSHPAAAITNTPAGTIAATDVQAAIDELDTEKEVAGTAAAAVATHVGLPDPHTQYQKESEKGVASGYASLDASVLVPVAQLPAATGIAQGAVELATVAETKAGVDTTRAVTPAGIAGIITLATPASDGGIVKSGAGVLTLAAGADARTITLSGSPTLDDWFDQSVKVAATPTFASVITAEDGYIGITGDVRMVFDGSAGYLKATLGDAAGADEFQVVDSGGVAVVTADSNGAGYFAENLGAGIAPVYRGHISTGDPGAFTAGASADDLVVQSSGETGLSIIAPDANNCTVAFGSPSDAIGALFRWNYTSGVFTVGSAKTGGFTIITADNNAERIRATAAGNVLVGMTTDSGKLCVDQSSSTGAEPALLLDQADQDYVLCKFIGYAAAASADRTFAAASDFTTPGALVGWIQIEIQDDGNRIADGDYYVPIYATPTA